MDGETNKAFEHVRSRLAVIEQRMAVKDAMDENSRDKLDELIVSVKELRKEFTHHKIAFERAEVTRRVITAGVALVAGGVMSVIVKLFDP